MPDEQGKDRYCLGAGEVLVKQAVSPSPDYTSSWIDAQLPQPHWASVPPSVNWEEISLTRWFL